MRPRVGHIQFLNCLPLYYGLVKTDVMLDLELIEAAPRDLSTMLLEGELDIAPIPSIEYARHADELALLPDISISSDGEVQSILLASKVPVAELDGACVALADTSRTSQALVRILLERHWGVSPEYGEMPSDLAQMMRDAQAALLIGDDALRAFYQPTDLLKYDLGEAWREYSGLPMVYAVWAARADYAASDPDHVKRTGYALTSSNLYSHEHLEAISEYAARWEPFPVAFFRSYFEALHFHFSEAYRSGLVRFFEEAHAIGQLDVVPELRIFGEE
jgi:chorismate dehydratase